MKVFTLFSIAISVIASCTFGEAIKGSESSYSYLSKTKGFNYDGMTDIIIFGDSYTTVTTDFNTMTYSGFNYSGGKNWPLYLTETYHKMKMWNYAVGGAVVDLSVVNGVAQYTPMTGQYKAFVDNQSPGKKFSGWEGKSTLFAVWFGINDIGGKNRWGNESPDQIDEKIVTSMFNMVKGMYDLGARNFMFIFVPPIEKTPTYSQGQNPMLNAQTVAKEVKHYNECLNKYAKNFAEKYPETNVMVYNSYNEFDYIEKNKGISKFWNDSIHPVSQVHNYLAEDMNIFLTNVSKQSTSATTTTTTSQAQPTTDSCWSLKLGYKCCSLTTNVVFTDADGEWGVENNEWCGLTKSSASCWASSLGYNCCDKSTCRNVIYSDADGDWDLDNNQWCGITSDNVKC